MAAAACGGSATEAIGTASGFNVARIPPEDRKAPVEFSGDALAVREGAGRLGDADLAGAVSVVNFWGSWCGPCRAEQPELTSIFEEYEARGVRFLGVNVRDSRVNAIAYREEFKVPYQTVFSPDAGVAFSFRVTVMPTTFVLDREGRIAARIVGAVRFKSDVTALLDEELARA